MAEKQLSDLLLELLAKTHVMSYHAQVAHWNTMGPNFPQYHRFFGELYSQLAAVVDVMAEDVRTLREFPQDRLSDVLATAGAEPSSDPTNPFKRLAADNDELLVLLTTALRSAEASQSDGIANHLQDRLSEHQTLAWMLRASQSK